MKVKFFASFGEIESYNFNVHNRSGVIHYKNEEVAQSLIGSKIQLRGQPLTISKCILSANSPNIKDNVARIKKLLKTIKDQPTLKHQVDAIVAEVELSPRTLKDSSSLFNELEMVLSREFRGCRALPFGSIVTGLGFMDSDCDVYMQLPLDQDCDGKTCVKKAYKVLQKNYQFCRVMAIPHAKTPIVTCVHRSSNISCDINFSHVLGVFNSHLLRHIVDSHYLFRPALLVLKMWLCSHNLKGQGKINSYTLVLLFVFSLQQSPNTILRPIAHLQTPDCINIQHNWNAGFDANITPIHCVYSAMSLPMLLLNFFKLYANFEYALSVICPLEGKPLMRSDFLNLTLLSPAQARYKDLVHSGEERPLLLKSPICLQDPFELNFNITNAIPAKLLEEFVACCSIATKILHDVIGRGDSESNQWLGKVLEDPPKPRELLVRYLNTTFYFDIVTTCPPLSLVRAVPLDAADKHESLRSVLFEHVCQFVVKMLERVLRFQVIQKSNSPSIKEKRMHDQADVHSKDCEQSAHFCCTGSLKLWLGRKKAGKVPEGVKDILEIEAAKTDSIIEELSKGFKTHIEVMVSLVMRDKLTEIECRIENIKCDLFGTFCSFLGKNLPIWYNAHLQQLNQQLYDHLQQQ